MPKWGWAGFGMASYGNDSGLESAGWDGRASLACNGGAKYFRGERD